MSKKSKNFILVLIVIFFVSVAFIFSENSSKISKFPDDIQKEIGDVVNEEYIFGKADEDVEEEVINDEFSEDGTQKTSSVSQSTYKVVKVVDGDTIDVSVDGKVERLRLIGIDTPETKDPRKGVECFGKEANNITTEILLGKNVSLESDETQSDKDRYGRLLRYVFIEDGTNFNEYMIREGYAYEYTYDSAYKYQEKFINAEINARENNRGLWSSQTCSGNK